MRVLKCVLVLLLSIGLSTVVDAKPPSGGFRSSSSSFKSSSGSGWGSRSSSSSKSGWGTKSSAPKPVASTATKSSFSTDRSSAKPATTTADSATYKKAKESGKAFSTPQAAAADFKAKSASKYTSTYKTEPASRPSHIPPATTVGGKTVNVTYNAGYGGYGYMHPTLGTWMMYDMMSDAVMMNAMMRNDGYVVGVAPAASVGSGLMCIGAIVLILFIACVLVSGVP